MAKKKADIFSALGADMEREIRPAAKAEEETVVAPAEPEVVETPLVVAESPAAEQTAEVPAKPKNRGGRPRKNVVGEMKSIRGEISDEMKQQIAFICAFKKCTEQDFFRDALRRAIERELPKAKEAFMNF